MDSQIIQISFLIPKMLISLCIFIPLDKFSNLVTARTHWNYEFEGKKPRKCIIVIYYLSFNFSILSIILCHLTFLSFLSYTYGRNRTVPNILYSPTFNNKLIT